jgi:tryptophan 2,3-dioxygenase
VDHAQEDAARARRRRDRLVAALTGDLLGFELAVADGTCQLLPQMRPDARTVQKRCRLALRVAMPALERLERAHEVTADDPVPAARELCTAVQRELTLPDRRALQLSMLPVYVSHDEYLFIRVLQLFETTFAMLAVQLLGAVQALEDGDAGTAVSRIHVADATLRESAPLFSLLGTMRVEAFRTFREFTDGASAIQSRNYKILESLCRKPDPERLDSAAYTSTPEVRLRVLAGNPTLDGAFASACAAGRLDEDERGALERAMSSFSETLQRWRQTHYRLAVRMLVDRTGTGHTAGPAYLKSVRTIDVFRSVDCSREAVERDAA